MQRKDSIFEEHFIAILILVHYICNMHDFSYNGRILWEEIYEVSLYDDVILRLLILLLILTVWLEAFKMGHRSTFATTYEGYAYEESHILKLVRKV